MESYKVYVINAQKEVTVDERTTLLDLSKDYVSYMKSDILMACVDNEIKDLGTKIGSDCAVEFFDITSKLGYEVYQRSVSLLMFAAANELYGDKIEIWVEHTINKNYYCEMLGMEPTEEVLKKIENKMHDMVQADYDIERLILGIDEGRDIFGRYSRESTLKTLRFVKANNITIYKLGKFYDYLYGVMVPSTSCLKIFKLTKFNDGFMLRFEVPEKPGTLNEEEPYPKLAHVFEECTKWSRILGVDTVGSLNESICRGEAKEIIWTAEALHEKKIAYIADRIAQKGKRLVMIAGPSSSGKTTFSKRLCIQLKAVGLKPHVISLDDYYLNRDEMQPDENGVYNFECLESLDVKLFNEDLKKLLSGERVNLPTFNFVTGRREYKGRGIALVDGEVLVIEGIHGINERLTPDIDRSEKFKIYISALTQLNLDEHNRISTTDTRMIRRIVRDNLFRGTDAKGTIDMWPTVLEGEEMNIFPYQEEADVMFNSALVYELSVLKTFVEPVLFKIDKSEREYTQARRLLNFLNNFVAINPSDIPSNSLLREFIGGSCFY